MAFHKTLSILSQNLKKGDKLVDDTRLVANLAITIIAMGVSIATADKNKLNEIPTV